MSERGPAGIRDLVRELRDNKDCPWCARSMRFSRRERCVMHVERGLIADELAAWADAWEAELDEVGKQSGSVAINSVKWRILGAKE